MQIVPNSVYFIKKNLTAPSTTFEQASLPMHPEPLGSSRGSAVPSTGGLRIAEVLADTRAKSWDGLDMPEGLPLGPDNSLEGVRDRIQTWAFALSTQDTINATQVRGKRVMLACHRYGSTTLSYNAILLQWVND
jgi:hypothetical protein